MDEEKDVYLQVSPPHLSIKSMDIYSIYTYEIHEGDKSLLYKDTGQKAIDRAHDIVENIIKDQLVFLNILTQLFYISGIHFVFELQVLNGDVHPAGWGIYLFLL